MNPVRLRGAWPAALLALAVSMGTAWAQGSEAAPAAGSSAELARLNRSMQELVDLFAVYLERQQVELLMRRIELKTRRLTVQEEELQATRSHQESVEEELTMLKGMVERLEANARDSDETPGLETSAGDAERRMLEEVESRVELLEDKRWRLEQKALDLDSVIERQRREIDAWEEIVDRELGLE